MAFLEVVLVEVNFHPIILFLNHPEVSAPANNESRGVWSAHVTCWCDSFINQAWTDPLWVEQSHDSNCTEPPCWICHEWRRFWVNEASGRCQWAQHANPASGTTELLLLKQESVKHTKKRLKKAQQRPPGSYHSFGVQARLLFYSLFEQTSMVHCGYHVTRVYRCLCSRHINIHIKIHLITDSKQLHTSFSVQHRRCALKPGMSKPCVYFF